MLRQHQSPSWSPLESLIVRAILAAVVAYVTLAPFLDRLHAAVRQ